MAKKQKRQKKTAKNIDLRINEEPAAPVSNEMAPSTLFIKEESKTDANIKTIDNVEKDVPVFQKYEPPSSNRDTLRTTEEFLYDNGEQEQSISNKGHLVIVGIGTVFSLILYLVSFLV